MPSTACAEWRRTTIAPRITPSLLGRVVQTRGSAPEEARLAAAILDEAIMQPAVQPPDPGSELTVKSEHRKLFPMALSITPGPMPGDEDHPFSGRRRQRLSGRPIRRYPDPSGLAKSTRRWSN